MISLEDLIQLGEKLPGTTFDVKWDHHLCFNVGGKMYVITSPDQSPINASIKVKEELFDEWIARPGVIAAPYLGRSKWIQIDDIQRLTKSEWQELLTDAHILIASKLTKKTQKELGLL